MASSDFEIILDYSGIIGEEKDKLPEVIIAPTFTSLYAANKALTDCGCGKVRLAAQNCFYETIRRYYFSC